MHADIMDAGKPGARPVPPVKPADATERARL